MFNKLRILSICSLVTLLSYELLAQQPESIQMNSALSTRKFTPQACADQYAGSTNRALGLGSKSSDKHFLCLGDSLVIVHQRNQNLSNDPNPATPPGIGYNLYDCGPNITGLRLDDIRNNDACLNRQSILINNTLVPPTLGFWMSFGSINGNINFVNNGNIQRLFNNNRPKKLYFAPMTIDDFANRAYESINSCTHANARDMPIPGDTFSVVYLNKILEKNITYNYGTNNCQFVLMGGLSEYDGSVYSISIKKTSNNAIIGTVTSGAARHNSVVSITVPESGTYTITITDGKSCDRTFTVYFPSIQLQVSTDSVSRQGDTACVKISARGFNNIISIENNFTYNHNLLRYIGVRNFNLPSLTVASFSNPAPAILTLSWNSNPPGVTRADNAVLFELCFETLGSTGSFTAVKITDTLNPIEVTYNNADVNNRLMGVSIQNGGVLIGNRFLAVSARTDSVSCKGAFTGRMIIYASGGTAPYRYYWASGGSIGDGNIQNAGDSSIIGGLSAGNYAVSVVDVLGIRSIINVRIGESANSLYATLQPTFIRCYGDATGQLRFINYGGGTAPYRFSWLNALDSVGTSISRLRAGNYTGRITDANNCVFTMNQNLTQPDSLRLATTTTPSTVGGTTGTATLIVTGGAPPYRYVWTRGDTVANINNLAPNTYTVTVTDANGCAKTKTISIITNGLHDDLSQKSVIRVFPNSVLAGEYLNISVQLINGMAQPIHMTMRDAFGRLVQNVSETIISDTEKAISIQYLPSGIYFMVFQSGGLQTVKTVIHAP
jgi:hypothetical protein